MLLGERRPEQLRQESAYGTFGLRTCAIHPKAVLSACRVNGFALRHSEHELEEVLKHTAAPDAPAPGLTRCPKI